MSNPVGQSGRALAAVGVASLGLAAWWWHRRSNSPPASPLPSGPSEPNEAAPSEPQFRVATQGDRELLAQLAGTDIVPARYGGGDFVLQAWDHSWWELAPGSHVSVFGFVNAEPAVFERCELYGPEGSPDTGWLEALRVRPGHAGKGLVPLVQAALVRELPGSVRELLLSCGSKNARMRSICDRHHDYVGSMVGFEPGDAFLPLEQPPELQLRWLGPSDVAAAWQFCQLWMDSPNNPAAQIKHKLSPRPPPVLWPARFYGFTTLSEQALSEAVLAGRVFGAIREGRVRGLMCTFDVNPAGTMMGGGLIADLRGVLQESTLSAAELVSLLQQFVVSLRQKGEPSLKLGPTPEGTEGADVDPLMLSLLEAAGLKRSFEDSHLRVYRVRESSLNKTRSLRGPALSM